MWEQRGLTTLTSGRKKISGIPVLMELSTKQWQTFLIQLVKELITIISDACENVLIIYINCSVVALKMLLKILCSDSVRLKNKLYINESH